jgi:chemotaxis protein MotB
MFFARPRISTRLEIWPTFVDALSTVLMTIVFVLMTFLVAQVFLVETINDRDTELANLQAQLRQFEQKLTKAKDQHLAASTKVTALEELIKSLNSQLKKLTQDLSLEQQQHGEQKTLNERIKTDLEKLEERLKQLKNLLQQAQDESLKKDDEVKALQLSLFSMEKEQEKHKNSIKVGQFRSQFFAQLKNILGDRSDVRVVDDRFIFQSEVLFAIGSADLGEDSKEQLNSLVKALKEIGNKIPIMVPENWTRNRV